MTQCRTHATVGEYDVLYASMQSTWRIATTMPRRPHAEGFGLVPRITGVGRLIRATRIDELPFRANVIRDDMSVVGPGPEWPHFVAQLARTIPFYWRRNDVKPGFTDWPQIAFPFGASIEYARQKPACDLYCVTNRSFLIDMHPVLDHSRRCSLSRHTLTDTVNSVRGIQQIFSGLTGQGRDWPRDLANG